MGNLRINKLNYYGDKFYYESPVFDKNITIIEGDNGTGKTTFMNLIYYALGGSVAEFRSDYDKKHKEIVFDTNNFVELFISINDNSFKLIRFIKDNDLTVVPYELKSDDLFESHCFSYSCHAELTKILPINRSADKQYIFSDWMLDQLKLQVIEFYQGYSTFKLNISDLFRLVYHNQAPDPGKIYKSPDFGNYVTDSELLRKAIFQLWIGKSFSDYYSSIVETKIAEKEKVVAKSLYDEYVLIASKLGSEKDQKNIRHLQVELNEKKSQLDRLEHSRSQLKLKRMENREFNPEIEEYKHQIITNELHVSELSTLLIALFDERSKLVYTKSITVKDVYQISKILHTHEKLNLFSLDTCPFCLSLIDKAPDKCVCGSNIDESQYERFIYSSKEYKDILKTKLKSISTIDSSITACSADIENTKRKISILTSNIQISRIKLNEQLYKVGNVLDTSKLDDIDDKFLEVRSEIANLTQLIEIETKIEMLEVDYDHKRAAFEKAALRQKELSVKVEQEIADKVRDFSNIYNDFLKDVLPACRSARIDLSSYQPIINDGEYREASSSVPIRLMYFLTMLQMSLVYDDVLFPRLLLIDTPETAGIEKDNLVKSISEINKLSGSIRSFQIILSTGLKKYPKDMKDNVAIYLPNKKHSLLKSVNRIPHSNTL